MRKRSPTLNGLEVQATDIVWTGLGIAAIMACAAIIIVSLVVIDAVIHPSKAQDRGWVIGLCVDDPFKITTCRRIGGVLPDKQLCDTVAASVARALSIGRVHCTRVLVDDQD